MSLLGKYTVVTDIASSPEARSLETTPRASWVRPHDYVLVAAVTWAVSMWAATGIPLTPLRPWVPSRWVMTMWFLFMGTTLIALTRLGRYAARGGRLRRRFLRVWVARHFGDRSLVTAIRYTITLVIVLTVYSSIKQAIPAINSARYDEALIAIERFVHAGWNPAWSLRTIEWPAWWFIFLDYAYYLWFPLMPLIGAYFLVHKHDWKRHRYFAAFLLLWLAADVIGLILPSHGPCYVDQGQFPPADMVMCRVTQDWLWMNYQILPEISLLGNGGLVFGCGLMAMPSLHVMVVCLYAIFLWNEGFWVRWLSTTYAALILIGSVFSGWHYAIDGYAGLVVTLLVVWGAAKIPGASRPKQRAVAATCYRG